ncbi:MAG: hypothetical protein GVY29_01295 [Spirochaetes bacterium]|jgi:hypothetical protein|nr:hypothetical protein [Spirochaetota bacterium]
MLTKRSWYIATGLVVVALILATDPFTILNKVFRRPVPVPATERIATVSEVMESNGAPAETYLASLFQEAPVVFLGEFPQIADHPRFVAQALPALASAGMRVVALEHVRSADQELLDQVTGFTGEGESFNADAANDLLFRRDVTWGFREYRDILEAAWDYNAAHPDAPVRIRGLSKAIGGESSVEEQEVELEAHMARELAALLEARPPESGGVLVFVSARRAIHGIPDAAFTRAAQESGIRVRRAERATAPRRLAAWVAEELDPAVRSVLLHAPWPDTESRYGMTYPALGVIDHAAFAPEGATPPLPWGFDIRDTKIAGLQVDPLGLRPQAGEVLFASVVDGYIVLKPLRELSAATAISSFVRDAQEAEALRRYPGDIPDSATTEDINNYIARTSANLDTVLESFRNVD